MQTLIDRFVGWGLAVCLGAMTCIVFVSVVFPYHEEVTTLSQNTPLSSQSSHKTEIWLRDDLTTVNRGQECVTRCSDCVTLLFSHEGHCQLARTLTDLPSASARSKGHWERIVSLAEHIERGS